MTDRVLFVDDDENVLQGYRRGLRKQFTVVTATVPVEALRALDQEEFAVVVADMKMPAMDGIEFLREVQLRSPNTIRMMLTGHADLETAMQAVNEGRVFRFVTKPCSVDELARLVTAGLRQYGLVTAERDLLARTLKGAIHVLADILGAVDPQLGGRALRMKELAARLASALDVEDPWEIEVAAMLSQIGRVTVPPRVLLKVKTGERLSDLERDMLARLPEVGHDLLKHIPRLGRVAGMVRDQGRRYDGNDSRTGNAAGDDIPLGARILKVVGDLVHLESLGESRTEALATMARRDGCYDPRLLEVAASCLGTGAGDQPGSASGSQPIRVDELEVGQVLAAGVRSADGRLLLPRGTVLTEALRQRLVNFSNVGGIREPIHVAGGRAALSAPTSP